MKNNIQQLILGVYLVIIGLFIGLSLFISSKSKNIIANLHMLEEKHMELTKLDRLLFLSEKTNYNLKKYLNTSKEKWLLDYKIAKEEFVQTIQSYPEHPLITQSLISKVFALEQQIIQLQKNKQYKQAERIFNGDTYNNSKDKVYLFIEQEQLSHSNLDKSLISHIHNIVSIAKSRVTTILYIIYFILVVFGVLGFFIFKSFLKFKRLNKEIKQSEEKHKNTILNLLEGFYSADAEGRLLSYNHQFLEILGLDVSQNHQGIFLTDYWLTPSKGKDFFTAIKKQGYLKNYTIAAVRKNGEQFIAKLNAQAIKDKNGFILRTEGTFLDITQQQLTENALKESEQKFKSLIRHAPDAIFIHDEQGNILETNLKASQSLGYSIEEIKKLTVFDLEVKINYPNKLITRWKNLSPDTSCRLYGNHKRKDGSSFPVEILLNAIYNKNKKVIIAFVRDISDRKKAEEETKKLTTAISQSPIGIVITNTNGIIEYANPFFEKTTGYSINETIGKTPKILNSGYHPKAYYTAMWKHILAGNIWQGEFRNKKKNGELYWEHVSISPVKNSNQQITHFIALKEDITEKKKILEDLQKAKKKAEESDRLKTTFLASMSHEIRTPLNSIVGFSNIIANESSNDDFKEYVQIINSQSEILLQLVDDLIDFSRIESESFEIKNSVFDLNSKLKSLHALFQNKCQPNVKLILEVDCEQLLIYSDRRRIKQIYINLISNAIKFTQSGTIKFGYTIQPDNTVCCFVEDTGIGISKKNQKIIFNRFTKLDDFAQGTGLGLSIVKKIITFMHGNIWIDSKINKGSTFNFTIPFEIKKLTRNATASATLNVAKVKNKTTLSILIAEDNDSNFYYLQQILKEEDFNILRAKNGQEAIDYVTSKNTIDLILMDVKMPILNGWEAAKQIKKLQPVTPIVMQTAHATSEDQQKATNLKLDGYICKPINKQELLHLIKKFQ